MGPANEGGAYDAPALYLPAMGRFIEELRARRVWRVIIAYPGVAFVTLEAVKFFIDNYGLDSRFLTATIIAAVGLLPAAVLWNWRHGEAGHQTVSRGEAGAYVVIGVATAAVLGWYWTSVPAVPRASVPATTPAPARSVAVLPFINVSGDDTVQYLCDGIAESLTNWLANVPDVRVAAKGAAFRLRDQAEDTAAVAQALGVDSLVRGRLEIVDGRVMVSASLVDTRDDAQLWGERLVQPMSDVIYLERSIVDAIKNSLGLKIAAATPNVASVGTNNPEAYRHYLRGHYLVQTWDAESIRQGLDELRSAIALDPKFGLPYADIADALSQMIFYGIFESNDALIGEARSAAYSAVALAPETPQAYTAMATMNQYLTFDWAAVEAAYQNAISRASSDPTPLHRYSDFLWATQRFEQAEEMGRRALEIDPKDGNAMHAVGLAAMYRGNYAAAVQVLGDWNRFYPGSIWSYTKYGLALAMDGQCESALAQPAKAEEMLGRPPRPLMESWHAWIYKLCDRQDMFERSRQRIEDMRGQNPPGIDAADFYMYELTGDDAALLELIQRIVDSKSPMTLFMQAALLDLPGWDVDDRLARDPRYRDVLRRLNFPPSPITVD